MRPLVLLLAAALPTGVLHAAGPVRADDPQRASAPVVDAPRPASKNAFGQAMAELARGLKQVRPAEAAPAARPEPAPPAAAVAPPRTTRSGG